MRSLRPMSFAAFRHMGGRCVFHAEPLQDRQITGKDGRNVAFRYNPQLFTGDYPCIIPPRETSIGSVWYDPEPERASGRWPDQDRERLAQHIARSVARAIGDIPGRVIVRTYCERIWVTAAPYDGGLPPRGAHGGDEPTRAGLAIRIEPPRTDSREKRPEYRTLVELRSWFQRPGLDRPIPFAFHMAHAMRAMRALGLVPRVDAETSDECRYDVRMSDPARDVATLVASYVAVPFKRVACDDDPRVATAADIDHCHAVRRKAQKRVRGIIDA